VLLLSDGQANAGMTSVDEIALQVAQLADTGVTTSTYGLGEGFNEELMVAIARSGRGNGYYSENAEHLLTRIGKPKITSASCFTLPSSASIRMKSTP
jgi:Ca-activated chloride channel family protein